MFLLSKYIKEAKKLHSQSLQHLSIFKQLLTPKLLKKVTVLEEHLHGLKICEEKYLPKFITEDISLLERQTNIKQKLPNEHLTQKFENRKIRLKKTKSPLEYIEKITLECAELKQELLDYLNCFKTDILPRCVHIEETSKSIKDACIQLSKQHENKNSLIAECKLMSQLNKDQELFNKLQAKTTFPAYVSQLVQNSLSEHISDTQIIYEVTLENSKLPDLLILCKKLKGKCETLKIIRKSADYQKQLQLIEATVLELETQTKTLQQSIRSLFKSVLEPNAFLNRLQFHLFSS